MWSYFAGEEDAAVEAFVEALGLLRDGGVASARPLRVNLGILKKQMYTHAGDVISQIYIYAYSAYCLTVAGSHWSVSIYTKV